MFERFSSIIGKYLNSSTNKMSENGATDSEEKSAENKNKENSPVAVFGVLTDIQYADIPDRSHGLNRYRYYRNSLRLVQDAVLDWKQVGQNTMKKRVDFVLHLGDIVDSNARVKGQSIEALKTVLSVYNNCFSSGDAIESSSTAAVPLFHVWGNHEMYNFDRIWLSKTILNTAKVLGQNMDIDANYYRYDITDKLTLICLDFYKFSVLGNYETDDEFKAAKVFLKNEQSKLKDTWSRKNTRFVAFNGGLGTAQTMWLDSQLAACHRTDRRAIVCGHIPLHRKASSNQATAWDAPQVIELLRKYPGTVRAYLAGHYHSGGYYVDQHGIHHVTLHAVLETRPGDKSYATVFVYANRVHFQGVGSHIPSFEIKI